MSNGRATGKKFRAVLQALAFASAGKMVKFICSTRNAQTEAWNLAKELSHGYNKGHTTDSVVFQSGGSIKFVHNHGRIGMTFDKEIIDDQTV